MTRTSGEQLGYEWSRWAPFSSPNPAAPVITPLLPSATLRLVLSLSAPDINSSRASHQAGQNSATTTAFLVVVAQVPERNGTDRFFFSFSFSPSLYIASLFLSALLFRPGIHNTNRDYLYVCIASLAGRNGLLLERTSSKRKMKNRQGDAGFASASTLSLGTCIYLLFGRLLCGRPIEEQRCREKLWGFIDSRSTERERVKVSLYCSSMPSAANSFNFSF